ncbi:MAG: pilus assembly protein [Rickettsiales bacterium]|jgi:hypothetical protein|nr:pilus assembly protein [Rickettsiales bacterium]
MAYIQKIIPVTSRPLSIKVCKSGASIIEFAIVAPVLMLFLVGFIELGLMYFTSTVLEGATNVSSRVGKTGFAPTGTSREDYIRSEVERLSGGYLTPDMIQIEALSYNAFSAVGQPEPCTTFVDPPPCINGFTDVNGNGQWDADQGSAGPGGMGQIVLYKVSYPWPIFTPLMANIIGGNSGTYTISAIATVKNERF